MRQKIRDETDDDLDAIYYIAKLLLDLEELLDSQEATEKFLTVALELGGLKRRAEARKWRKTPALPRRDTQ